MTDEGEKSLPVFFSNVLCGGGAERVLTGSQTLGDEDDIGIDCQNGCDMRYTIEHYMIGVV